MLTCDEYNHERLFNTFIYSTRVKIHSMKHLLLSILFNLILFSSGHASSNLKISNPWIPETPPGARVMAGFMQIQNTGNENIDIIAVRSPDFKSVEMHLSKEVKGVAKMLQQEKLSIPAKSQLTLKAGSYHLMLMKPLKQLQDGEHAQLSFSLSNGEIIKIDIPVRKNKTRRHKIMKCGPGKCGGG